MRKNKNPYFHFTSTDFYFSDLNVAKTEKQSRVRGDLYDLSYLQNNEDGNHRKCREHTDYHRNDGGF